MKPLAQSLDKLQGENGMYMGYLLPVLSMLKKNIDDFEKKNYTFCQPLVLAIKSGYRKRWRCINV